MITTLPVNTSTHVSAPGLFSELSPLINPGHKIAGALTDLPCADLFCGAGGTSTGLLQAARKLGLSLRLVAVNHSTVAIRTHGINHPKVEHLCDELENADPRRLVPGGRLILLVCSPECIYFSNARGAKPINDQSRASARYVLHWAKELDIENILLENVPEFASWGPLLSCNCGAGDKALEHAKGCTFARPDPARKGEHFDAFLASLRALGYDLEWKVLTCADYGDATTRKRFFLQAKKRYPGVPARPINEESKITWPAPTHAPRSVASSRSLAEWRPARDIIDWAVPGRSIFGRKKGDKYPPLKPNTLRRIFAGLLRFSGLRLVYGPEGFHADARPYVVILRNNATARGIAEPVPAIMAQGQHLGLAQPVLRSADSYLLGQQSGYAPRLTSDPVPAIATAGKIAMVQPYFMAMEHSTEGHDRRCHDLGRPLPTLTGTAAFGLAQPFLTKYHGSHAGQADGDGRSVSVEGPIPTLDTSNRFGLASPCIVPVTHSGGLDRAHDLMEPSPTVTTAHRGEFGLCVPELEKGVPEVELGEAWLNVNRTHATPLSLEDPLRTLTTGGNFGLCEPLLVKYYGTGGAQPVGDPLDTVTTRDRFALVDPRLILKGDPAVQGEIVGVLDILYRMLLPRELAAAHSFPTDYFFFGTQEQQVKQVGNSVPVSTAEALCTEILRPYAPGGAEHAAVQGFQTHGLKEAV